MITPARPPVERRSYAATFVRPIAIWAALTAWQTTAVAADRPARDDVMAAEMGNASQRKPVDPALRRQFVEAYTARYAKQREVFERYLPHLGAVAILDYLEERFPHCHGQAHELGSVLYAETRDLTRALQTCGQRCTGACMHGVIREAFGDKTLEEVEGSLDEFCRSSVMSAQKPGNCAHAMGHALMVVSHRDLGRSLAGCSAYSNKAMGYYCATGVYMEYFADPPKPDPKTVGPHFPCDTQKLYPAACYRYMGIIRLSALRSDARKFTEECLALSGARRLGCFHGLGTAYALPVSKKPELLAEACKHGTVDDRAMCIEGAIEKLGDLDEKAALSACAALKDGAGLCERAAREKMYRLEKPTLPLYTLSD